MKEMQQSDCGGQTLWEWELGQRGNSYYVFCGVGEPWFLWSFTT